MKDIFESVHDVRSLIDEFQKKIQETKKYVDIQKHKKLLDGLLEAQELTADWSLEYELFPDIAKRQDEKDEQILLDFLLDWLIRLNKVIEKHKK